MRAEVLLQKPLRTLSERTIAAGMTTGNSLANVSKFGADETRFVEWDVDFHVAAASLRRLLNITKQFHSPEWHPE
jgi:hypothetical protein